MRRKHQRRVLINLLLIAALALFLWMEDGCPLPTQEMALHRAERQLRTVGASSEVDLRGMMTDEAVAALDSFLDNAMLAKLETVTIIHGKGTGAVRKAVREHLKRSRYVKSFRPGRYGEGEDGVTVAELR